MSPIENCRAKGGPENCKYHSKLLTGANQFAAEYAAANTKQAAVAAALEQANWHERQVTLFKTPHGSRLYGLAHANSDEDYFIVYPPSSYGAKQSIVENIDATRMSFNYFLEKATVGSHQALEAMFSRQATVDNFAAFRAGFHATGPVVFDAYLRTVRNFSMGDTFKKRRHGLRLALNLVDLTRYGRFDPTLTPAQAKRITDATNQGLVPDERYLDVVREIVPREFTYDFEHEGQSVAEHIKQLAQERAAKMARA